MFKAKKTSDAVSPVIGVILLVAVTVALVALATVIVFDIGSDVSDSADATVQLNGISDDTEGEGMQANIIRNNNVVAFTLTGPEGEVDDTNLSEVGDSVEMYDGTGTYTVVAELPDGSEEVLTSSDR